MTGKTTIEWTDQPGYRGAVWNPTTGCTRVSAGCDNCYAFALHDQRYASNLRAAEEKVEGTKAGLRRDLESGKLRSMYPGLVGIKGGFTSAKQYDLPFSRVQLLEDRLDVPLTRTPTCYFVDSMSDLFHEDVPDAYLDRVFASMELEWSLRHRFLILTKRPDRMQAYLARRWAPNDRWWKGYRPEHIWLGTSVEDQGSADERIPHLLASPAAVRFLSCEPLLGPVDLTRYIGGVAQRTEQSTPKALDGGSTPSAPTANTKEDSDGEAHGFGRRQGDLSGDGELAARGRRRGIVQDERGHGDRDRRGAGGGRLDWVIVGGESGARARPMDLAWARSLVDQCRAAGVAPFVKQLGSTAYELNHVSWYETENIEWPLKESHGRDMAEWPADLRVREFPR